MTQNQNTSTLDQCNDKKSLLSTFLSHSLTPQFAITAVTGNVTTNKTQKKGDTTVLFQII